MARNVALAVNGNNSIVSMEKTIENCYACL